MAGKLCRHCGKPTKFFRVETEFGPVHKDCWIAFTENQEPDRPDLHSDGPDNESAEPSDDSSSPMEELWSGEGRIGRRKYWLIQVSVIFLSFVVGIFAAVIMGRRGGNNPALGGVLGVMFLLPLIVVQTSTIIKRWHDLSKSGWFTLLALIPYVNVPVLLYLGIVKGTDGSNQYGENPVATGNDDIVA